MIQSTHTSHSTWSTDSQLYKPFFLPGREVASECATVRWDQDERTEERPCCNIPLLGK